jgi:predicted short-subunit dehydrogenase-like oxidoreductase (DUF2520 family)
VKRFSVIGAGNVGVNLIHALIRAGYDFKYIYKKAKYDYFNSNLNNNIRLIVAESDFIFISTQESKISEAADLISRRADPSGKIFFHTANSLTSAHLLSIKKKGGFTASFSPLQTFVDFNPAVDLFSGIYFLAEGDAGALETAEKIARSLKANILFADKEEKEYIHIAAVSSSNFLISILKFAENQLKKCSAAGSQKEYNLAIMLPLIKQTLQNVAEKGVETSLSGPLKRKETNVLNKHLSLLEKNEAAFYKTLTEYLKK